MSVHLRISARTVVDLRSGEEENSFMSDKAEMTDELKYETALIAATSMLFSHIQDMTDISRTILERHPESSDVASQLKDLACSSHSVSRMVVEVMPDHVRRKLDEIWSKVAAEKATGVAMEEKGELPLN
jgi:hypothetical protein